MCQMRTLKQTKALLIPPAVADTCGNVLATASYSNDRLQLQRCGKSCTTDSKTAYHYVQLVQFTSDVTNNNCNFITATQK